MNDSSRSAYERRAELRVASKVWDALEDEDTRQDFSHYNGVGRYAQGAAWQGIGDKTLATLRRLVPQSFWDGAKVALEWGPGGGSNILALSAVAKHCYGVDISQKNLEECIRAIGFEPATRFTPIHLHEDFADVQQAITQPVDIFVSTAVFQHFPSQAFGSEVLALMAQIMAPGAVGLVQIRFDNGAAKYKPNAGLDEYPQRFITATSYSIDGFAALLASHGFEDITARDFDPRINYVTFGFRQP